MKGLAIIKGISACSLMISMAFSGVSQVKDQDHSGSSMKFKMIDDRPAGQSFTPFAKGNLHSISLDISAKKCFFNPKLDKMLLEITILEGDGTTGNKLSSDSVEIRLPFSRKFLEVQIKSKPELKRSGVFTIVVTNIIDEYCEPVSKSPNYLFWYNSDTNSYSRGKGYFSASAGHNDFYFKTYIIPDEASSVASADEETLNHWQVYPNPSKDIFNVSLNGNTTFKLTLFNFLGKKLFTRQAISENERLNLSAYPNGIYLLSLESNGKSEIVKLVKE